MTVSNVAIVLSGNPAEDDAAAAAAIISAEDAVKHHAEAAPERVADTLPRAITSVIYGNAQERTEKMRERASRLDAVARLL